MRLAAKPESVVWPKNLKPEAGEKKPRIRFSVTIYDDQDIPLITQNGWLINEYRTITPPQSKVGFGGHSISFTVVNPKFIEQIQAMFERLPETREILGPRKIKAHDKRKAEKAANELNLPEVTLVEGKEHS